MRMRILVRIQVMVVAAIMVVVLAILRFRPHTELAAAVGVVKQSPEDVFKSDTAFYAGHGQATVPSRNPHG